VSLCVPASQSPFVLGLQSAARTHSLPINVGIHEPTSRSSPSSSLSSSSLSSSSSSSRRIANTLIWIDADGAIAHRYQKLHLFDVDLGPEGPVVKESESVEAGREIVAPIETCVGRLGLQICFDVRFAEPGLALRRQGAQTLVYPSAFTVPTGQLHWEVLLRARAIEGQSWVVAAAQCGRHNGRRVSYGDSMVVSPRGEVVGRLGRVVGDGDAEVEGARQPELLLCQVDLAVGEKVRKEMPLLRRTDVYPEV
jgi:predicted amidohydrolase